MLTSLSKFIQRISRGWVVILLLILYIFTIGVIFPFFSSILNVPEEGVQSIDTLIYYTPDQVYDIMEAYGEQGRRGYAIFHITADLIYPIVYAFFFATTISFTFIRVFPRKSRRQLLNLFPFGLAAVDLLENIVVIVLLLAFPNRLTLLAFAAGIITLIKWLAVAITVAIPIAGLILWVMRLVRKGIGVSDLSESEENE